ncbi:MAG: hypothetical protein EBR82_35930 [Caulobacteraceae bacterium]|nr:hypothetical protein [Caulobacteraceae bacterium]
MKFPDINPAGIDAALRDQPCRQERKLTETLESINRLVARLVRAKARATLIFDAWHGMLGNTVPCGGNKIAVTGGWIGTGEPRKEPDCYKCANCYESASSAARGAELALESMIGQAAYIQREIDCMDYAARMAGATSSRRLGKSDIDSRYGGYHD